ncbi:hypothetical protein F2P81_016200 [Scophthalmus maximus]|uniref:Uncharacterized protein n=1 Tax=Scophthalmus maximus TaxID=52904 RepID=A0A6A4SGA2_SCOMX|nr:hypothetical protein F2P81_016200 [Scophthalmus maximus]
MKIKHRVVYVTVSIQLTCDEEMQLNITSLESHCFADADVQERERGRRSNVLVTQREVTVVTALEFINQMFADLNPNCKCVKMLT